MLLNVPIITILHGKTANLAFYQKKRGLTFTHFNLEVIPFYVFYLCRDKTRPLLLLTFVFIYIISNAESEGAIFIGNHETEHLVHTTY